MIEFTDQEKTAIKRYKSGESPTSSTFIDEQTITYGYGKLDSCGSWEFEIPHSELNQGEAKTVDELMARFYEKHTVRIEK